MESEMTDNRNKNNEKERKMAKNTARKVEKKFVR